jgi:glucose/arabinose dehydrogenase
MKKSIFFYCSVLSVFLFQNGGAQIIVDDIVIQTNDVARDLDTPWEILWGPDDHIWITERFGRISRVDPATTIVVPLITIDEVYEEGESGLLGMALHPDFSETAYVYLVYNYFEGGIRERIVRYTYEEDQLTNPLTLLENIPGSSIHNGSRILFGSDEKLYFSLGDAANTSNSQDTEKLNGKILRMDTDGGIPDDNPFPGSYVWSFGHRNPQGMVFTPGDVLFSSEHGPQNDDELNLIEAGANYGWPEVHGFCDENSETDFCNENDITEPLMAWTPTLAVAGLDYYAHEHIGIWQNKLLMVTLKTGRLMSLTLSENGREITGSKIWIDNQFGRLRDLCVSPGGRVFIATSNRDGRGTPLADDDRIIELVPGGVTELGKHHYPASGIRLFPNPVSDYLIINLETNGISSTVEIVNNLGQLVILESFKGNDHKVNVTGLIPGMYRVTISTGNLVFRQAVLINR